MTFNYLKIIFLFLSVSIFSQTYQPSDFMFTKEITRAIDLREKENESLYSIDREISTLLIAATLTGTLTPYFSDSLDNGQLLTLSDFRQRITIENGEIEKDTSYMDEDEKEEYLLSLSENSDTDDYFFGKDLYQMEMTETLYFSKNSSEMRHRIKTLTIFLPADHPENIRGIQQPIATYDFNEIIKVFKDDPNAIWYNPKNDSEHRSLEEAFDLRLFSSYIIKVSNPNDDYLVDIYDGEQQGIIQATEKEYQLLEFESNMWEN